MHLAEIVETDSRLSLTLQLYLDAISDRIEAFRLVKLYNALECLASEHKKDGVGSRDAIRKLLNINPGLYCLIAHDGKNIHFELIEFIELISVVGIVRDKTNDNLFFFMLKSGNESDCGRIWIAYCCGQSYFQKN